MKIGLIALGVIGGIGLCYLFATNHYMHGHSEGHGDEVTEGYHKMEDGTLMKNSDSSHGDMETTLMPKDAMVTTGQETVTLDPNAKVFEVRGVNYDFDISEIKVKKGETVTINFESTDGFHDIVIDEFSAKTKKVQPGVKTSVTFVADKAGTFEYYCSIGSHRANGMVGKLVVGD
jgi:nitrite reductase (NO-forming)